MIARERALDAERLDLLAHLEEINKHLTPTMGYEPPRSLVAAVRGTFAMPDPRYLRETQTQLFGRLAKVNEELRVIRETWANFQSMTLEEKVDAIARKVLFP